LNVVCPSPYPSYFNETLQGGFTSKDPTGNDLIPANNPADSAFSRLHLPIATLLATSYVILLTGYPIGRIDNSLLEASLALDQPNFRRTIRHIGAFVGSQ